MGIPVLFLGAFDGLLQKQRELLVSFKIVFPILKSLPSFFNGQFECLQLLLVTLGTILQLHKLLILLLALHRLLQNNLSISTDFLNHFVLLLKELFFFLIELLGFLNDVFLLLCETVVNLAFFSLLLQKADRLQRTLRLYHIRSNFI